MRYRLAGLFSAALVCALLLGSAEAHAPRQSYIFLRVYDHALEARLEITAADLDRALRLGLTDDDEVSVNEVEQHLQAILDYVRPRFGVSGPEGPLAMRFEEVNVHYLEIADYVMLTFRADGLQTVPEALDVRYDVLFEVDPRHRNMLVVEHNWGTGTFNNERNVSLIFRPAAYTQTLDLSSSNVLAGFIAFIQLGAWHIWIGLDHILFLLALTLPSVLYLEDRRWRPAPDFRSAFMNIVTIVTCFTIAHSITLSLAALDLVRLPDRLVESIIAASIAVAALHNLFPRVKVKEWLLAFVFGLFHGFGFANVLGDIGLEAGHLVLSLAGFNLGVEFGQVVVILLVFPLLYAAREQSWYQPVVLRLGSALLIAMALMWFVERAFDVTVFGHARRAAKQVLALMK